MKRNIHSHPKKAIEGPAFSSAVGGAYHSYQKTQYLMPLVPALWPVLQSHYHAVLTRIAMLAGALVIAVLCAGAALGVAQSRRPCSSRFAMPAARPQVIAIQSTMCKWTQLFWGTGCQRSPKSLSSAQAASLCSAGIERARKCLQAEHFVRCCHSTRSLLFRGSPGVARGGQQRFAPQTLCVHLLGIYSKCGV